MLKMSVKILPIQQTLNKTYQRHCANKYRPSLHVTQQQAKALCESLCKTALFTALLSGA